MSGGGPRVSRRAALAVGAVGAGAIALGGAGLAAFGGRPSLDGPHDAAPAWAEPPVIESSGGILELDLEVAERDVTVAGTTARMLAYNGSVPGPTLHLRPGDRLRIRLANGLDRPTNLHTHGLEVSPAGPGDNPLIEVAPGESFDYRIDIPSDHPPGVFWYHPHRHGLVADQVFGGLYGAIVLDGEDWASGAPRVAVVSDTTLVSGRVAQPRGEARDHGRVGETVLTNGLAAPVVMGAAGAVERILVINACATRHLDLDLGGRVMHVRGFDGGGFAEPRRSDRVRVVPGGRADLLIDVPDRTVDLVGRAVGLDASGMGVMARGAEARDATIFTLAPGGAARDVVVPAAPARTDLRGADVARRRTILMTGGMNGMGGMHGGRGMDGATGIAFLFDGKEFDPDRVDQRVAIGDVEEWVLENMTPMSHPFHLHTWPMQLMESPDGAVDIRDVVDVPPMSRVAVRVAFARHPGTTVYHCHILDHEDVGMMGVIAAG